MLLHGSNDSDRLRRAGRGLPGGFVRACLVVVLLVASPASAVDPPADPTVAEGQADEAAARARLEALVARERLEEIVNEELATQLSLEAGVSAGPMLAPDRAQAPVAPAVVKSLRKDTEPPINLIQPVETVTEKQDLVIRARVRDPSGVQLVTVWVRGENDEGFQGFPMELASGDVYVAKLAPWQGRGRSVAYFIESLDNLDNGPARSGDPDRPFLADIEAVGGLNERIGRRAGLVISLTIGVFLVAGFLLRRPSVKAERRFWNDLLRHVLAREGDELMQALDKVCSVQHRHPIRGRCWITRVEALSWVEALRRLENLRSRQAAKQLQEADEQAFPEQQDSLDLERRGIEEDLFWLDLLGPLVELSPREVQKELRGLSKRPHAHPHEGARVFDMKTLRRRMEWAYRIDQEELLARWNRLNEPVEDALRGLEALANAGVAPAPAGPPAAGSASRPGTEGASLIELLAVIAITAIFVGATALYLKPAEAPLRTSGEMLDGLMKQARLKAVSTTTAHRVRPFDDATLFTETAATCTAATWVADPRMEISLASGVTLAQTAWSVCFDTRGLASENLTLTLSHDKFGSKNLEILKGGAVRWVD